MKKKSKGYTREFKNDDPTTALSHIDQQKRMLLDTIDDAKPKKVNTYVEPEMNDLNHIAESRLKYEARKFKKKPEFYEKNTNLTLFGNKSVSPSGGKDLFFYSCCGSCAAHFFDLRGSFWVHFGIKKQLRRGKTNHC